MYVYFIKTRDNAQLIKIGKAADVQKRLGQLQTGNASQLKLMGTIECSSEMEALELERKLHEMFKDLRVRGEWFRCSQNLRNFIRASCSKDKKSASRALRKHKEQIKKKHFHKGIITIKGINYDFRDAKNIVTQYLKLPKEWDNETFLTELRNMGFKGDYRKVLAGLTEEAVRQGFKPVIRVKTL